MEEVKCYYNSPVSLAQAEKYIEASLVTTAREYVAIGHWLRRIRDDKLFQEEGYKNFEEYVRQKYHKDAGWASKCIKVNAQFSVGGNSPHLSEEYRSYSKYQLVELAYMSEGQRELVGPDTPVRAMKQIRKPEVVTSQVDPAPDPQGEEPEEKVVTSQQEEAAKTVTVQEAEAEERQPKTGKCYHRPEFECTLKEAHKLIAGDGEDCAQKCCWNCGHHGDCNLECYSSAKRPEPELEQPEEPLSAYGTPMEVYPEDSLITTPGCEGGHDCFCCHLDCDIRQQDCYCVEAPMGNPFPCEMVTQTSELQEKIGARCQMVNHDLADHRAGDHEPVPCCKKCADPCEYMCSRARNARDSAAAVEPVENPQDEARPWEEEKIDESYNIGDLPQAKESLLRQLAKVLVERCGSRMVLDGITHTGGSTKKRLRDIDQQDDGITLQDGVQAYPSEEIIEFFRGEEDLGVCTYARFETQARKALDEWVRGEKPQAKQEPEPELPKEVIDAEFSEIPAGQVEDVYDSVILAEMIRKAEKELTMMADCWKENQPDIYKRKRMALEAYKMYQAVHEREEQKHWWIPVEERLPDQDDMVLVTCRTKKGMLSVNRAYLSNGFWHGSGTMSGVIAWMPLPEPYQPA